MTEGTNILRKIISWKSFALQNHFRVFNSSTVKKKKKRNKGNINPAKFHSALYVSVFQIYNRVPRKFALDFSRKK